MDDSDLSKLGWVIIKALVAAVIIFVFMILI